MRIKIYLIPLFVVVYCLVYAVCHNVCEQRQKSFQFVSFGHARNKISCQQLCCQSKKCQVSVYTGKKCFGLNCNNAKFCRHISQQLRGFDGHRVDKRSLGNLLTTNTSALSKEQIPLLKNLIRNRRDIPENDYNFYEDEGDKNYDGDKNYGDNEPVQKTRYDDDEKRQENNFQRTNENEAACSHTKIHHSIIPQRNRGFIFHKFHGHTPSLSHCDAKCCEKDGCILSFKLERNCYGIVCGRDRNCHTKRDWLPQLGIFFSSVIHVNDRNENDDRYHLHHRNKIHSPFNRNEESKEEKELMNSLEKDATEISETDDDRQKEEGEDTNRQQQEDREDERMSLHRQQKKKHHHRYLHRHKQHQEIHQTKQHGDYGNVESHAEDFERDSKEDRIPFIENSHRIKVDSFDDDNDMRENKETHSHHHESLNDELHDDVEMLMKRKHKIKEQYHEDESEDSSGSGGNNDGSEFADHHYHPRHRYHLRYHHHQQLHREDTQADGDNTYNEDMKRIFSANSSSTTSDHPMVNGTEYKRITIKTTPQITNLTETQSSLIPANVSAQLPTTAAATNVLINVKSENITTRSKIEKPVADFSEPNGHRYEHKEDIFKEFSQIGGHRHSQKDQKKEPDEESSGEEESSGDGDDDFIEGGSEHEKKKKKKLQKQKYSKHSTSTTAAPPTTSTTTATTLTTTLTTTTTTTSGKKVVAVLKYQRHPARPTKALHATKVSTTDSTTTTVLTTTATPSHALTSSSTKPRKSHKQKKILKAATATTTKTPLTTVTVIPTVEVDGITPFTTTANPIIGVQEEDTLKDLTKTKLKSQPNHLLKNKKIPSLNIAVGDEDVDGDYGDVFPKQSKTPNKPLTKISSASTTLKQQVKQKQQKSTQRMKQLKQSVDGMHKTSLFPIPKTLGTEGPSHVKPMNLTAKINTTPSSSKKSVQKTTKEVSQNKNKASLTTNAIKNQQNNVSSQPKSKPNVISKTKKILSEKNTAKKTPAGVQPFISTTPQTTTTTKTTPTTTTLRPSRIVRPTTPKHYQQRYSTSFPLLHYDQSNPMPYPYGANQQQRMVPVVYSNYDDTPTAVYPHESNQEPSKSVPPRGKYPEYDNSLNRDKVRNNDFRYTGYNRADVSQNSNYDNTKQGTLPEADPKHAFPTVPKDLDPSYNPYNLGYKEPNKLANKNFQPKLMPTLTPHRPTLTPHRQTFTPHRPTFTPHRQTFTPYRPTLTPHRQTFTPFRHTSRLQRPTTKFPYRTTPHHRPTTRVRPFTTTPLLHSEKNQVNKDEKPKQNISEKSFGKNVTKNEPVNHKTTALTNKESPQDTVNRILGSKKDHLTKDGISVVEKPVDTIHRLLGKNNKLDDFFKESSGISTHKIEQKNQPSSLVPAEHERSEKEKLENFFKKTEVEPAKKNVSEVTGTKKANLGPGSGSKKNTTIKVQNEAKSVTTNNNGSTETLPHVKGCPINRYFSNKTFLNPNNVGYMYKVPQQISFGDCVKKCCSHDTCHVVFYDEKKVCNLVQCAIPSLCNQLSPTKKNVHLVFMKNSAFQQKYCEAQNSVGVPWQKTKAGEVAARDCPRDAVGEAKRDCSIHSKWLAPDFSDCVSSNYANIRDKANGIGFTSSAQSLIQQLDDASTETIDNSLIFGGDLEKATETVHKIAIFLVENRKENFGHDELKGAVRIVSNLLDTANTNEWSNIKDIHGPSKLMKSLEMIGAYAANRSTATTMMKPVVTPSIIAHIGKVFLDPKRKLTQRFLFPGYSQQQQQHSEWIMNRDTIALPKNLFKKDRATSVSSMVYKTLGSLLPQRWKAKKYVTFTDGYSINSNILSCIVNPLRSKVMSPPVLITLHHLRQPRGIQSKCVWWDFSNNNGTWSTDGCSVVKSNRSVTVCKCSHLTNFAILSNSNDQKVSAKEQAKEHTMAIVWLGIPMIVVVAIGALYTCFAWSKVPRRRHVVIMDKKPRLPNEDVVTTQTVSEKYPGSPNKNLYAANNCTSSPSDLEWEHAWDILTNSEFDSSTTKELHQHFKKQLIRTKLLRSKRRNDSSESSSTSTVENNINTETLSQFHFWKSQDDDGEWRKENFKHLGDGLLDVSSENAQPSSVYSCDDNQSSQSNPDLIAHHIISASEPFSPVAMSSPHSLSFEEMLQAHALAMGKGHNYLQLSFDSPDFGIRGVDPSSMSFDSLNQFISDIEMTYEDLLSETTKVNKETIEIPEIKIQFHDQSSSSNENPASDDTGYQSPPQPKKREKDQSENQVKHKLYRDHIFCRWTFETFECNEFCCITYIENLFVCENENYVNSGTYKDRNEANSSRHQDIGSPKKRSAKLNLHLPNKLKRTGSLTPVSTAIKFHKYLLQNTTVSASGCRIKKSPNYRKQSPSSLYSNNTTRLTTRHLKNYIELRQQCRKNDVNKDEDIFPCSTKQKTTKQSQQQKNENRVIKSNLKRQMSFKVGANNDTDTLEKARQNITQRNSVIQRSSFKSKELLRTRRNHKKFELSILSVSSSMESLLARSLDSNESSLITSEAGDSDKSSPCEFHRRSVCSKKY